MPPNNNMPWSFPLGVPLAGSDWIDNTGQGQVLTAEQAAQMLGDPRVNFIGDTFYGGQNLSSLYQQGVIPYQHPTAAQTNSGLGILYGAQAGETPQQRLDRIVRSIIAGETSFDSLRGSVDWLAGSQYQQPGVGTAGDQQALAGGYQAVLARVQAIFDNRGVPLTQYQQGGSPGQGGGSGGTGGGPGSVGNPGGNALDAGQRDALAVIRGVLSEYGLESLADWAWDQVKNGYSSTEIILSLRERQEFKDRFPAIEARQRQGLAPISPGEYVAYERSLQQMETAAGLLRGTLSGRDKVNTYLERDLSVTELQERVNTYIDAAVRSPAEDVAFLRDTYGLSPGELASFFIDPDVAQPLIEQRWQAAQVGGAGLRVGYEVSGAEAESIARLGVGREGAQEGFGTLASSTELFSSLPGENGEDISRSEQIGAVFGGNEFARKRIAKKQRERVATFEQGGGFGVTREGFAGLGAAR